MARLAPRPLLMTNVTDGTGSTKAQDALLNELSFATLTYQKANAIHALHLTNSESNSEAINDFFADWMK